MATTDTWDSPALDQPISADLPAIQRKFQALVKGDPSLVQNPPVGAKRLVEISSGNWQVQQYNGSTWANLGKLQMDVDTVDGHDAAITPQANTIAVRNASGKLEGDITGNAATADSAATLSEPLGVELGGTGAKTAAQARTNLGVPPTSHGSTDATYGVGNASQYGHLKLSDAVDSTSGATGGVAATPAAVKAAKDAADVAQLSADKAQSDAEAAMTKASTLATASAPGIGKPGTGMTVDAAGALNVDISSTSNAGIVQLEDLVTSDSINRAATANAVSVAYKRAEDAKTAADAAQKAADAAGGSQAAGYLVEAGSSPDKSSWYEKWSNGFIIQGGNIPQAEGNDTRVSLPIPFSTTKYSVTLGLSSPITKYSSYFIVTSTNWGSSWFLTTDWIAAGY